MKYKNWPAVTSLKYIAKTDRAAPMNALDHSVAQTHVSYILKACTVSEWCTKLLCHLTFNSFNSRNELEGDFIPNLDVAVMAQDIDNIQEFRGIGLAIEKKISRARRTRFRGRR
jgi:hypothetical protein